MTSVRGGGGSVQDSFKKSLDNFGQASQSMQRAMSKKERPLSRIGARLSLALNSWFPFRVLLR